MEEEFENCKREFDQYIQNFDMTNASIARKYYHSFRVVEYAEQIAVSEHLSEQDIFLAKVCALLHDIGRFKQVKEFQECEDKNSFDHGDVGYEILLENNYISHFLKDKEDQEICLKAVKNHNKFAIETGLLDKEMYFAKLVRDSDKLDLLDTQANDVKDGKTNIDSEVMDALKQQKLYRFQENHEIENEVSLIVMKLCFLFDFNFQESFIILENKKIIARKIDLLRKHSPQEIVDEIEAIINQYIEARM